MQSPPWRGLLARSLALSERPEKQPAAVTTCAGYVRRVTHDEIADAIGENSREILGTTAYLAQISQREQQHAGKAGKKRKHCSLREASFRALG
jgi:hypothetical protein